MIFANVIRLHMPQSHHRGALMHISKIKALGMAGKGGVQCFYALFLGNVFIKHYHNFALTFFWECSTTCLAFLERMSKAETSLSIWE